MKLQFELTGVTPLLQHQDDVEASDMLTEWRRAPENKGISAAGDDRSPAWTWQTYLYSDGEKVCMASANLMVCLRAAGAQITMKKQKTFKELTQSGMYCEAEYLDFEGAKGPIEMADIIAMRDEPYAKQSELVKTLGFSLYAKRARIGQSKHVRVRPRFDTWTVKGVMVVMAKELTREVVTQIFDLVGNVGLCDWRPGCKTPGNFGIFTAKVK